MSDLKRIQEIELEMLRNFHTLCTTNNLSYYIVGGTLLGAIRHGGFIPWDDDIDIAMPRDDYEKFINIYSKEMPSFLEVKSNPLNLDIVQIVNKNTLIELGKQKQGVFIDIFPIDGAPAPGLSQKLFSWNILFYRMLCKLSVLDILEERDRGRIENLVVSIAKIIYLPKILNTDSLLKKLGKKTQKYSLKDSLYSGVILGRYREKELLPTKVWGMPKEICFESIKVYAPSDSHSYLTSLYGDYMKLPPENMRISHNIKLIKS